MSGRLLRAWGRAGVAPGYCYQAVERWGGRSAGGLVLGQLFNGCEVVCDAREHIQRHILYFGAYEVVESYLFYQLLGPGMTVVDAGANIGQYTLIAAERVGPSGHVHAFEPIPSNYEKVIVNVCNNGFAGWTEISRLALWDVERPITLNLIAGEADDNASNYTAHSQGEVVDAVECLAARLDDYVRAKGVGRVDVMKVDIEGAELPALRGAREVLDAYRPTILLEVNRVHAQAMGYEPEDLGDYLRGFGYSARIVGHRAQECTPIDSLRDVDRANVLFSRRPLPGSLFRDWTFKTIIADYGSGRLAARRRV